MRDRATLLALAILIACRSNEPSAASPGPASDPAAASATDPTSAAVPATKPEPAPADASPSPSPSEDPERAAKLADLDALCAALDHDYVDGTLSDYYAKVEPKTAWGRAQKQAGDESITPGRLLEKAIADLSPEARAPELGNCRKLLEYLDEVE